MIRTSMLLRTIEYCAEQLYKLHKEVELTEACLDEIPETFSQSLDNLGMCGKSINVSSFSTAGNETQLKSDIFDGVEFMRKNIIHLNEHDDVQIKVLWETLFCHIPDALPIAVATINYSGISLCEYYEKTKNRAAKLYCNIGDRNSMQEIIVNIALESIQNYEQKITGGIATAILSILGYITPCNVDPDLFVSVLDEWLISVIEVQECSLTLSRLNKLMFKKKRAEIDEAIWLLQSYNLITKSEKFQSQYTVSIHRMVQTIIRRNTESSRTQILRQILNCKGFLGYKLIPFCHSNEELKNEFPQILKQLIPRMNFSANTSTSKFPELALNINSDSWITKGRYYQPILRGYFISSFPKDVQQNYVSLLFHLDEDTLAFILAQCSFSFWLKNKHTQHSHFETYKAELYSAIFFKQAKIINEILASCYSRQPLLLMKGNPSIWWTFMNAVKEFCLSAHKWLKKEQNEMLEPVTKSEVFIMGDSLFCKKLNLERVPLN